MHSVLSTVEADRGVAIVPASARILRADNISFFRLQPDDVRIDFVAAWQKKEPSIALKSFHDVLGRTVRHSKEDTVSMTCMRSADLRNSA